MLTGIAEWLGGEARKGCELTMALWSWGWGLRCHRARGSGVAGPRPMEHDPQPHQGDQQQLVEEEVGDQGKPPSHRWSNEGILPASVGYRISRRLVRRAKRGSVSCGTLAALARHRVPRVAFVAVTARAQRPPGGEGRPGARVPGWRPVLARPVEGLPWGASRPATAPAPRQPGRPRTSRGLRPGPVTQAATGTREGPGALPRTGGGGL
jgi:hypothetical protein